MEGMLKSLSILMLAFLISIQISLTSPYRSKLTDDTINGRILKLHETAISKGVVVLDSIGGYLSSSVIILVNGQQKKLVDVFPVELELCEGDVVEIELKQSEKPFYVFLSSQKGQIETDLTISAILIEPGINRFFSVRSKR